MCDEQEEFAVTYEKRRLLGSELNTQQRIPLPKDLRT
jgi:hypothetical protein